MGDEFVLVRVCQRKRERVHIRKYRFELHHAALVRSCWTERSKHKVYSKYDLRKCVDFRLTGLNVSEQGFDNFFDELAILLNLDLFGSGWEK